jgi:hypothetical protein
LPTILKQQKLWNDEDIKMKKECFKSVFLVAALGLSLITVSPQIQAAEELKSPITEVPPLVNQANTPITKVTTPSLTEGEKSPILELAKEKENLSYRLVYADNSPLKTIPLNNTEIKVRVYANGTPKGDQELKTNEEAEFDFDKLAKSHRTYIGMNLVQIQDQAKNNQICQGHFVKAKNELVVTCQKKNR